MCKLCYHCHHLLFTHSGVCVRCVTLTTCCFHSGVCELCRLHHLLFTHSGVCVKCVTPTTCCSHTVVCVHMLCCHWNHSVCTLLFTHSGVCVNCVATDTTCCFSAQQTTDMSTSKRKLGNQVSRFSRLTTVCELWLFCCCWDSVCLLACLPIMVYDYGVGVF